MRLLRTDTDDPQLVTFNDETKLPKYAILSHTWLSDEEEVTFGDLSTLSNLAARAGWVKIDCARKQARKDGFQYVWIDTCCIDKQSSAELAEAINSMYRWYRNAEVCYVFLLDLTDTDARDLSLRQSRRCLRPSASYSRSLRATCLSEASSADLFEPEDDAVEMSNFLPVIHHEIAPDDPSCTPVVCEVEQKLSRDPWHALAVEKLKFCRWFSRGWTLQEMVASTNVRFYGASWQFIGTLEELAESVTEITGVESSALRHERPLSSYSIAQRMCWAAKRSTTRIEDRAYSLLGIFDISMAVIYGEGERAFQRLQEELLRAHSDQTLFAWGYDTHQVDGITEHRTMREAPVISKSGTGSNLLASSPQAFVGCANLVPLRENAEEHQYQVTGNEVRCLLPIFALGAAPNRYGAVLSCVCADDSTKVIVLYLTRSQAGYFVSEASPRSQMFDLYDATLRSSQSMVNIFRYADLVERSKADEQNYQQSVIGIMCRYRHTGADEPLVHMVKAEPSSRWDKDSCCFRMSSRPGSPAFHNTHCDYNDDQYTLAESRDARMACSVTHIYILHLQLSDASTIRVKIEEDCYAFETRVCFHPAEQGRFWSWYSPRIISRNGLVMVIRVARCRLLHEKTAYLVEMDSMKMSLFLKTQRRKLGRYIGYFLLVGIGPLIALSLVLLATALPVWLNVNDDAVSYSGKLTLTLAIGLCLGVPALGYTVGVVVRARPR